jgi:hypothetical protein
MSRSRNATSKPITRPQTMPYLSSFGSGGFPPEMHAVVVYRAQDGLIHDVVLLV